MSHVMAMGGSFHLPEPPFLHLSTGNKPTTSWDLWKLNELKHQGPNTASTSNQEHWYQVGGDGETQAKYKVYSMSEDSKFGEEERATG